MSIWELTVINKLKGIIIVVLILLAGHWDYEDAKAAQEIYCANVATGHWPDFRKTFHTVCAAQEAADYE